MKLDGWMLDEYLFSQLVQKGNLGLGYLRGIREYRVLQPLATLHQHILTMEIQGVPSMMFFDSLYTYILNVHRLSLTYKRHTFLSPC